MNTTSNINEDERENNNTGDNDTGVAECHHGLCNKKYKLIKYYNAAINKTYIHLDINEEWVNQGIVEEVIKEIIEEIVLENVTLTNMLSRLNGSNASVIDASIIDASVMLNKKKSKKCQAVNNENNEDETHIKPKLNFDKINNIVKLNTMNESNELNKKNIKNIKNISLEKKISLILKRINIKIQTEFAKETMNYMNILKSSKKPISNDDDDDDGDDFKHKLSAIYYLILNKIDKKL